MNMSDEDMLAAMRHSLAGARDSLAHLHMTRPPEAITARARTRRLRRLSGAGAAGTALGVGLALALSSGPAAPRPVHVNLDAWSVNTTPSGLVDITIRELLDPALLRQDLADAGVPAVVTFGEFCTTQPGSPPDLPPALGKPRREGGDVAFTINPAAMPAGTELTVGLREGLTKEGQPGLLTAWLGLVTKGVPLTCGIPAPGTKARPDIPKAAARPASTGAGTSK
jgi:hypothetical protein